MVGVVCVGVPNKTSFHCTLLSPLTVQISTNYTPKEVFVKKSVKSTENLFAAARKGV
jgi:hypothetical protein